MTSRMTTAAVVMCDRQQVNEAMVRIVTGGHGCSFANNTARENALSFFARAIRRASPEDLRVVLRSLRDGR